MTKIELSQLASDIASNVLLDWKFLGIYFFLSIIALVGTAFLSSYFLKRGESFATKADFKNLLNQLEESTTLTEQIRNEVSTKFSEMTSKKSILRQKIEDLLTETYSLELWLEQSRSSALRGNLVELNGSPLNRIDVLSLLYFSEIEGEHNHLKLSTTAHFSYCLDLVRDHSEFQRTGILPPENGRFDAVQRPFRENMRTYRNRLIEVYAERAGLQ